MAVRRFRAVVGKEGSNPFVDVPPAVSRAFAAYARQGRVRVAGTLERHPFHATLVPKAGGVRRLYVNGGMRAATGVEAGDRVALALHPLRPDEAGIPADLARALAKARLRPSFDRLSPAHRRELVRSIEDARTPRNRAARIEGTIRHLRGEPNRRPRPATADSPLWTCPRCGHRFVTKNMNHSCARHDLMEVFHGRPPRVRALFDRFRAMVDDRGPTTMVVYRDRVAFMVKVRFAGATPGRDHLDLGFWFTDRDEDARFSRIETIATNVHVHRTRIRTLDELDGTVRRWIDRAYRVGRREHLR